VEQWEPTARTMLARSTQTNEAARCATLLPELSRLQGPLSLIEVGASAGLCLFPDRYSYVYTEGNHRTEVHPRGGPSPVVILCELRSGAAPTRVPEIAWRTGLDLNPLDVANAEDLDWLETLIWPEHDERRRRLHLAARLAAAERPRVLRASVAEGLDTLLDEVPAGTHPVVFHSAVLLYLEPAERQAFVHRMTQRADLTWMSNEGSGVLPAVTARVRQPTEGRFILSVDGDPVALTGPHGQSYEEL
jgi:hypothetical protein